MKKYYKHKGKCYGYADKIKSPFNSNKEICFGYFVVLRAGILTISLILLCLFVALFVESVVLDSIGLAITIASAAYFGLSAVRSCRRCVYCSDNENDVKQLIDAAISIHPENKNQFTNIQYIDGLYVVFSKSEKELYKERYNDVLNSPNTYIRPYPKEFKRARNILLVVGVIAIAACFGVVHACSVFNVVRGLSGVLCCLPAFLILPAWMHYCKVVKKYKDEFRKEENFPADMYSVTVKGDKNDGGRFVYIIQSKDKQG